MFGGGSCYYNIASIHWDIVKLRGVFDSVPVATAEVKGVWQYNVGLFISYVFVIRHLRAFEAREVAVGVVMSRETQYESDISFLYVS